MSSTINTFFLRVAARCNLNCDYCYVFKHRDMSWKTLPPCMSIETLKQFSIQLRQYLIDAKLNEANIIFHGGEPLIIGPDKLIDFSDTIVSIIGDIADISFSLQTNGTLLNEDFLNACEKRNIGVSLSIDGPASVHNKHRCFVNGDGSFDIVYRNIELLRQHPQIFDGVIGVIDPSFDPDMVLSFFEDSNLYSIDLLLPDSTYQDPPIGRNNDPNIYKTWLCDAFDSWFEKHQLLKFRTFEHILRGLMGIDSTLDAFGLGELDYLTIETDGSYHTTDILKVAYENASSLGLNIFEDSIETALRHPKIKEYNTLLSWEKLPAKCKSCAYGNICGGGSLPHRYSEEKGFNNPTIYCDEMFSLINHAKSILQKSLESESILQ